MIPRRPGAGAGAPPGPTPCQAPVAQPPLTPTDSEVYGNRSPYGYWNEAPDYGWYWQPDNWLAYDYYPWGWLGAGYWGQGLATEGATASLRYGFDTTGADHIVAVTSMLNVRSPRVMQRLGMTYDPSLDFDHPTVPAGHRLSPHVLYRITRAAF